MRSEPTHIYLATDGKWLKIGITANIEKRINTIYSPRPPIGKKHKITLLKLWTPREFVCPRYVERRVRRKFKAMRAAPQSLEWFKGVKKNEIITLVETLI